MLDERGGISNFGWAVVCSGRRPDQVGDDVQGLVQWSACEWKRHFPPERGYRVCVESSAGIAQGVRMTAQRGDFLAEVSIERGTTQRGARSAERSSPSVRAYGRARSETLHCAYTRGERLIRRSRVLGSATGVGLFVALAWAMIGVNNPIFVLGGMLLVVALLLMLTAGGTLGTWFGERLAAVHRNRARQRVDEDGDLVDDIRRWKAVGRKLVAKRSALASGRGQPFRRVPTAVAS